MKKSKQIWLAGLLFLTATGLAFADGRELSDEELDDVVAGTVNEELQEELLSFSYVGNAGSRHEAVLDGTLSVSETTSTGLLLIDNGAQTGLNALVSINAVNSEVNVLLNLNITINSTVGEVRQINIRSQ
jgi:hypothetical protein